MRPTRLFLGAASACFALAACGGGGGSGGAATPPPVTGTPPAPAPAPAPEPDPVTQLDTKAEAADFLQKAGFGATDNEVNGVAGADASRWVASQMNAPRQNYRATVASRFSAEDAKNRDTNALIWQQMIASDAQLRNRMTFALSQLIVFSDKDSFHDGYAVAEWLDVLDRHAFGNYRELLGEVTTNPKMGAYLTYLYNRKGDPRTGRTPDENYARELLQLFTIGLVELNMDGTPKLSGGEPVETFDNDDIVGLARVFTGYALDGTSYQWRDRYPDAWQRPMRMWDDQHSPLEKSFLGTTIAAGTPGTQSVEQALDAIFAHPNVAPFVSRQLIQRFTASSPAPDYVERVANVFEAGRFTAPDGQTFGRGVRGDLSATLAAILLDESVHDGTLDAGEGKVREPVLKFVNFARLYAKEPTKALMTGQWTALSDTSDPINELGQTPLRSPSVFNFYRPGYIAPSTEVGEAGLTAPELQIVNASSALGYANFMSDFITRSDDVWDGILVPDLSEEVALADDPAALADRLDIKLLSGRMSADTRAAMVDVMEALPVRDNSADNTQRDRLSRARLAVLMAVTSPEYAVQD